MTLTEYIESNFTKLHNEGLSQFQKILKAIGTDAPNKHELIIEQKEQLKLLMLFQELCMEVLSGRISSIGDASQLHTFLSEDQINELNDIHGTDLKYEFRKGQ